MKKLLFISVLMVLGTIFWQSYSRTPAKASAPQGMQAIISTSSRLTLSNGTQKIFVIAASSTCVSRVISTTDQPIMIKFADYSGFDLNGMTGYVQAASSTVAYDSGLYGCGQFSATSLGASAASNTQATISEFSGFR